MLNVIYGNVKCDYQMFIKISNNANSYNKSYGKSFKLPMEINYPVPSIVVSFS